MLCTFSKTHFSKHDWSFHLLSKNEMLSLMFMQVLAPHKSKVPTRINITDWILY